MSERSADMSVRGREIAASGVLQKFGLGRVKTEQKEEIRNSLIRELEDKGLTASNTSTAVVAEEVDKFIQNGHISGTNIDRLERRVFRRTREGAVPLSARDQHTATSELFSVGRRSVGSQTPRPRSVEGFARRVSHDAGGRSVTPGGPGRLTPSHLWMPQVYSEGDEQPKWSELAAYAKIMGEKDKVDQRSKVKATQEKMRLDLQSQMQEKELQSKVKFEEQKQEVAKQKVELQAWLDAEALVNEDQKKLVLDVKKKREVQIAVVKAMRQDEKRKRFEDDSVQMKNNAKAQAKEKKAAIDKKNKQKDVMIELMAEWAEDRNKRNSERKRQAAEEQAKVIEYHELLDRQEARNRQNIPVARMPKGEYVPPNYAERRKEERKLEEEEMAMLRAANVKSLEDEQAKLNQRSQMLQTNQEFLNQQREEKGKSIKMWQDEKQKQKEKVQAEAAEFQQSEKSRAEQQRMKNVQYRLELERQIATRKTSNTFQKSAWEDTMSHAEVAMNRRLLEEARSTLNSWSPGTKRCGSALSNDTARLIT